MIVSLIILNLEVFDYIEVILILNFSEKLLIFTFKWI